MWVLGKLHIKKNSTLVQLTRQQGVVVAEKKTEGPIWPDFFKIVFLRGIRRTESI